MQVLILNADYRPLGIVPTRRAFALIERGAAELLHAAGELRTAAACLPRPSVLRLRRYARVPARVPRPTHRAVLARDAHTCAYCGRPARTVDHVYPQHLCRRDGVPADTWLNLVAACAECNHRKGGRTLQQAGLVFRAGFQPSVPRRSPPPPGLARSLSAAPAEWAPFLGLSAG